jgi:ATP-binding cassette subfamily B protein
LEERQALDHYLSLLQANDKLEGLMLSWIMRGWLVVGLIGLAPALVSTTVHITPLAVGLGGVLLADQALRKLVPGFMLLIHAKIAWEQIALLISAGAREEKKVTVPFSGSEIPGIYDNQLLLSAHNLVFRHFAHDEPILNGCNLSICEGDRLLLTGESGSGKSTLISLLAGFRVPDLGFLRLKGDNPQALQGERGRRHVAVAPQFHENHILSETFAFNVLLGRRWPPNIEELKEAEEICRELGLDDLLTRMPGGMFQWIGETGWQLSHGERSRLFIARALLQEAELVILDESFAALDPESLQRAMECALKRAKTLLVVSHP